MTITIRNAFQGAALPFSVTFWDVPSDPVSIATAGPIAGLLGVPLSPFWLNFRNAGTPVIYLAIDTLFASMPFTR